MKWSALLLLGVASWLIYLTIALVSPRFAYDAPFADRPIPFVLALLILAFVLHLTALAVALRLRPTRWLVAWIVTTAIAFRLTLLPSTPIQEIDIYRYAWDGAVSTAGLSPFRFSPQQVLAAAATAPPDRETLPDDLARLVRLHDSRPALAAILSRVHFPEVPTVYPPVSQAVFAIAALLTPREATVAGRLLSIKALLLVFDLATLSLVMTLLRQARRHVGWSVAYAWCPLVMKEFANCGHLDAIAVCLTTAAVCAAVHALLGEGESPRRRRGYSACALVCLSLAVGAKLYPIILAPLFLVAIASARGWREGLGSGILLAGCTTAVLWPMLPRTVAPPPALSTEPQNDLPTLPDDGTASAPQDPSRGLQAFLGRWEMNDFLFMLLIENVKPLAETPADERPWFGVMPEHCREWLVGPLVRRFDVTPKTAAFLLVRAVTTLSFVLVAMTLAWRGAKRENARGLLTAAFLTLSWFWLLSPTQNPWYWTWALPFVPFVRRRLWLLVSGLALVYYARFWFDYQWPNSPVPGSTYRGTLFFDFIVTWIEFGPLLSWLVIAHGRGRH